jgi:hypothetical protein
MRVSPFNAPRRRVAARGRAAVVRQPNDVVYAGHGTVDRQVAFGLQWR